MNIKKIFGTILTLLGIAGLLYAAVSLVNKAAGVHNVKEIVIYGILGLIFFFAGVGLIRTTTDAP